MEKQTVYFEVRTELLNIICSDGVCSKDYKEESLP